MKVLITGFDPFNGETINPAFEAIKLLPDTILNVNLIKLEIPTVFKKSIEYIEKVIEKIKPDIIILVGQAGGRSSITVERVAINIDDTNIKDNEGNMPIDIKIKEDGENAYFSNLPIKLIVEKMINNNIPANISNDAGTFVCNHVMYGTLYLISKKYNNIKSCFIHVPYIPEQVLTKSNIPSMSLKNISKGLEICIKTSIENNKVINIEKLSVNDNI
jgi:pyroglutamyl-peptidase